VWCCTPGVGVCVVLYTGFRCMCCLVYCVCVYVVQCDGTDMYGIVWPLLLLLRIEVV